MNTPTIATCTITRMGARGFGFATRDDNPDELVFMPATALGFLGSAANIGVRFTAQLVPAEKECDQAAPWRVLRVLTGGPSLEVDSGSAVIGEAVISTLSASQKLWTVPALTGALFMRKDDAAMRAVNEAVADLVSARKIYEVCAYFDNTPDGEEDVAFGLSSCFVGVNL